MAHVYKKLTVERWAKMSVCEQMANIGSEVGRAFNWRNKGREDLSLRACNRALDLIDLSLSCLKSFTQLKEFARMRELIVDYFYGSNSFHSSEILWRKYFDQFNYLKSFAHKKEHAKFVKKALEFKDGFENGHTMLSLDVVSFLKEWLVTHIKGSDKDYTQCFNENGLH